MADNVFKSVRTGAETRFFETGYIMIDGGDGKGKAYDVEEISINLSRDLNPYHVASQRDPISQRPGRTKIDFSFKRAFGDKTFLSMFYHGVKFYLMLFNADDKDSQLKSAVNDSSASGRIVMLTNCRLSQDNIGPVNGGDIVSEDIQGSASGIIFDCEPIKNILDTTFSFCSDNPLGSKGQS